MQAVGTKSKLAANERFLGYLCVLASAVGSCCVPLFAKFSYEEGLNLTSILFWRYVIASTLLMTLYFVSVKRKLSVQMTAICIVMGMIGHAFSAICFFNSIQVLLASVSSVLLYTFPAMVVLLQWVLERKTPGPRSLAALFVSFVGCVLVVSSGELGAVSAIGVIYGLGSAFFYAGFIIVSKPVLKGADPVAVSAMAILGATSVLVALTLADRSLIIPQSGDSLLLLLGLALVSTVFPVVMMLYGIKRIGPSQASIVSTSEPVFTLILSYLLLGERLSLWQSVGSALIILSLLILAMQRRGSLPFLKLMSFSQKS